MSLTSRPILVGRPGTAGGAKEHLNELLGQDMGSRSASQFEERRLLDLLKVKEKTIEEQMREISTLKSNLAKVQKDLMCKQSQMEGAQEKAAQALGGASARSKELDLLKTDKRKLEGQVAELMRNNAKLRDQLAAANEKNPGVTHQIAALQASVRSANTTAANLETELKAVNNQLRLKDKELARLNKLVDDAAAVVARNGELENRVRQLSKQLDDAGEELRMREGVLRQRDGDIAKMNREVMGTKEALGAANAAHADTTAQLKAMSSRCADQELEMGRLRDELARTGAVAARVAAAEVRAGSKDEGTVHITQHLEEVKYWQGEANRLKDKVASLEKQLLVADELKSRYRATAERLGSATSSRSPSPSRTRTPSQAGNGRTSTPGSQGGAPSSAPRSSATVARQLRASILDAMSHQETDSPKRPVSAVSASPKPAAPDAGNAAGRVTRSRARSGAGNAGPQQAAPAVSAATTTRNKAVVVTRSRRTTENDTATEVDVNSK